MLASASCVSPHTAALLTFPRPQVQGPFASTLSAPEILQIAQLPWGRADMRKPVYAIYMTAPDAADVSSGRVVNQGDKVTGFKVRKVRGHWEIVRGSIYETQAFVTS
jgi:hypothetical protein